MNAHHTYPGKASIPNDRPKTDLKNGQIIPNSAGAQLTRSPDKLTPERQQKICDLIRKGNRRNASAIASGLSSQTMENWMASGEVDPDGPTGQFRAAVLEAEAEHEIYLVQRWAKINDKVNDYKGVERLLQHRHRWEPPATKTELTGANGGPITLGRADLEALSPEQLEQHLEIMETLAKARMKADMTLQITDGSDDQE